MGVIVHIIIMNIIVCIFIKYAIEREEVIDSE